MVGWIDWTTVFSGQNFRGHVYRNSKWNSGKFIGNAPATLDGLQGVLTHGWNANKIANETFDEFWQKRKKKKTKKSAETEFRFLGSSVVYTQCRAVPKNGHIIHNYNQKLYGISQRVRSNPHRVISYEANALSRWGPIEGLSNLYCIGERKWGFQKQQRKSTFFESPKNFIVRMGGWVGGDILGHLIFLKIGCDNKQDVLIPNMASKVVYGY